MILLNCWLYWRLDLSNFTVSVQRYKHTGNPKLFLDAFRQLPLFFLQKKLAEWVWFHVPDPFTCSLIELDCGWQMASGQMTPNQHKFPPHLFATQSLNLLYFALLNFSPIWTKFTQWICFWMIEYFFSCRKFSKICHSL